MQNRIGIRYGSLRPTYLSSECEPAFSSAKRMITDDCYKLKSDILEADQCPKSWFKNSVADGQAASTTIAAAVDDEIVDITGL